MTTWNRPFGFALAATLLGGCQAPALAGAALPELLPEPPAVAAPALPFAAAPAAAMAWPAGPIDGEQARNLLQAAGASGFQSWFLTLQKNPTNAAAGGPLAVASHTVKLLPKLTAKDKSFRFEFVVPADHYLLISGIEAKKIAARRFLVDGTPIRRASGPLVDRIYMFPPRDSVILTFVRKPAKYGTFHGYLFPTGGGFPPPK